jgi:hypothetical protein
MCVPYPEVSLEIGHTESQELRGEDNTQSVLNAPGNVYALVGR